MQYRSSLAYRMRKFARERQSPDPRCVSFTHDRDYETVQGKPRPEERFARTAWCPPPRAEYDGFEGVPGKYGSIDPMHRDLPFD